MKQRRFAVPVHTLFVVPVIARDAIEAAEIGRLGVRRMLTEDSLASADRFSRFHVDAASVVTVANDVTELPPPA